MYSHEIPTTVDVHLNTIEYPIEVNEYALLKADSYKNGEIINLFIPDKNKIVLSRATIATMIEFKNNVVPFKIIHHFDIIEIYRYTSAYLEELAKFSEIAEANDYMTKARLFFNDIERSMHILAGHGNQQAQTEIRRGNIGKLIDSLGGIL